MRVIDNRVQILCPTTTSLRRVRRPFKPFSSPVAITQDRVRHTDNASSAVLSTADSIHTTNARPLQEQLRDQMDLHQLQREPVPEDTSDGESRSSHGPSQAASSTGRPKRGRPSTKTKQEPERKGDPSRRRIKRQSTSQSDQPKTVAKKAARAARSGRAQIDQQSDKQAPDSAQPESKHSRTLTKQEDVALCSAIKASNRLLRTTRAIALACHKCTCKWANSHSLPLRYMQCSFTLFSATVYNNSTVHALHCNASLCFSSAFVTWQLLRPGFCDLAASVTPAAQCISLKRFHMLSMAAAGFCLHRAAAAARFWETGREQSVSC